MNKRQIIALLTVIHRALRMIDAHIEQLLLELKANSLN